MPSKKGGDKCRKEGSFWPDEVEAPMVITLGWPGVAEGRSPIAGPRVPLGDYVSHGTWA